MDMMWSPDAARRIARATANQERRPKGDPKGLRKPQGNIPQWFAIPSVNLAARASGAQMISGKVTLLKASATGLLSVISPPMTVTAWNFTGGAISAGVLCVITWVGGLWTITVADCSGVANGLTPA